MFNVNSSTNIISANIDRAENKNQITSATAKNFTRELTKEVNHPAMPSVGSNHLPTKTQCLKDVESWIKTTKIIINLLEVDKRANQSDIKKHEQIIKKFETIKAGILCFE